jgi:uncharacterized protein (DUF302 family)
MKVVGLLMFMLCTAGAHAEPLTAAKTATLREAIDDLTLAALDQNYQLVKVQPIDSAMVKRGFADPGVIILFIGNPEQMRQAGEVDARLLTLLPLRLTLKRKGEEVEVSSDDLAPWAEQAASPESRKLVESWQTDLRVILDDYTQRRN